MFALKWSWREKPAKTVAAALSPPRFRTAMAKDVRDEISILAAAVALCNRGAKGLESRDFATFFDATIQPDRRRKKPDPMEPAYAWNRLSERLSGKTRDRRDAQLQAARKQVPADIMEHGST